MTTTTRRASLTIDGRERTFTVVSGTPTPHPRDLVLIFHGSRQNADAHRKFTGGSFDALADSGAAVVVYLDGFRGNWNDSRRESYFPARLENIDDVAFARAVMAEIESSEGTDPARVFALGYSNGGQMVMRLVHEAGELLAGAAIFSATMPAPDGFITPPAGAAVTPIPVLLIHGTRDPIVPFEGGTMSRLAQKMFKVGGSTLSMPATAEYFARRNGMTVTAVTRQLPSTATKTSVDQTDYVELGLPPVRLLTVHGAGHTIPGPKTAPFILGRTHTDLSTADSVAEFFDLGRSR